MTPPLAPPPRGGGLGRGGPLSGGAIRLAARPRQRIPLAVPETLAGQGPQIAFPVADSASRRNRRRPSVRRRPECRSAAPAGGVTRQKPNSPRPSGFAVTACERVAPGFQTRETARFPVAGRCASNGAAAHPVSVPESIFYLRVVFCTAKFPHSTHASFHKHFFIFMSTLESFE